MLAAASFFFLAPRAAFISQSQQRSLTTPVSPRNNRYMFFCHYRSRPERRLRTSLLKVCALSVSSGHLLTHCGCSRAFTIAAPRFPRTAFWHRPRKKASCWYAT
ncbi:hypothetical protein PF005_g18689 [Phytophthora fragariae]|uniref:Uncharacterized protein n=1 Tax=Phytophthora fragariae TaxID=53985 RepID=A0A6A3SNK1_9STRA|nr:hypothetical protein PF003_g34790 [Phytophthora fragariae]KAE8932646.1 hypothetical protein PF009_g17335 [Phytophthora fragariae]KAE8995174.1 hypothetical protein PF011_g16441 [Phytophthora fragariae]KAE9091138.1 hypothetical protein PF010_g18308 [Phytophthora fragariae]KAE9101804.1 hypothetical protein PF007_g14996 [Phytophthora fragariae]